MEVGTCTTGSICCQKAGDTVGAACTPMPVALLGTAGGSGGGDMKVVVVGTCPEACGIIWTTCGGGAVGEGKKSNKRRGATPLPLPGCPSRSAPARQASGPGLPPVFGIGDARGPTGCEPQAEPGKGARERSSRSASGAKSGGTVFGVPRMPVVCLMGVP